MAFRAPNDDSFTPTPLSSLFPLDNPPPRRRLPIDDFLDFGSDPEVLALNDLDRSGQRHIGTGQAGRQHPNITFNNNEKNAPSPDQPVTPGMARMMEDLVRETGLTININSTTGGKHDPASNHYRGKAIDINRVNGKPVGPDNGAARILQDAAASHPNIRENFGPHRSEKTDKRKTVQRPDQASAHSDHIHISGQE